MSEFQITIWSALVGAALSLAGIVLGSWINQRSERRQQLWQAEIKRILELEERTGQLVEVLGGYHPIENLHDFSRDGLRALELDAGRFRRHKAIMQAIRDLHNGLGRLLDDKLRGVDFRETSAEVRELYEKLLVSCDGVTGARRM